MFKKRRKRNSDAMKFLGFYPDTVVARVRANPAPLRLPTLGQSLGVGAGGFGLVIMIVMAIAAVTDNLLKKYLGDKGGYAFNALLFILMAGGVFRRLLIAPAPVLRVYVLFAAAFLLTWRRGQRPIDRFGTCWASGLDHWPVGWGWDCFSLPFSTPRNRQSKSSWFCVSPPRPA